MFARPVGKPGSAAQRILILSRHDYRTKRRASVHFIAEALAAQGHHVDFLSIGFSRLSRKRGDSRLFLEDRANRWETVDGVNSFLWRSPWHAVDVGPRFIRQRLGPVYDLWSRLSCRALDDAARQASIIFVESGTAPMFLARLRRIAPRARIVYRAADLLPTVGVHPHVQKVLERDAAMIDLIVAVARPMLPHFAAFHDRAVFLSHGVDRRRLSASSPNPYRRSGNVVTAGSMLFDAQIIATAAEHFPRLDFHLIGTPGGTFPSNVHLHAEMPFAQTLPYLQHADIGVAPYRPGPGTEYLVDSSLKLLQFGALGLPAVCPAFAAGDHALRFGYAPDDRDSIIAAFEGALAADPRPLPVPDWSEVAERLVEIALG
ncbi:polysaccharide biosynthesis protein GumK [Sphingomonas oleivorans]|uniref:Polysaccharide biosynthesis protein GumK n=2 Tax=Sphingomonas oleivorans TaxID=1735121 RepID=A0A2T5FZ91_9SPHN|nr:polysaccharide biosynthesis protein GumK [Sphingomonas oleivorans]